MKRTIFLLAVLLGSSATLLAQTKWKLDKAKAKIGFNVRHMLMSTVDGSFKKFEATIVSPKPDFSDAVFEVTIDAASINTDNEKRDKDLKSDSYFNIAKYPEITFKSTGVTKTGGNNYKVSGNLTMHGVTKPVTLELTINAHKPIADVKMTGTVSRTDFGIGSVPRAMIGDEITIKAEGEFSEE